MPTVKRFANCKISIYADHAPPHFHILGADVEAVISLETLEVMEGDVRRAREAMEWAAANRDLLMSEWLKHNKPRS